MKAKGYALPKMERDFFQKVNAFFLKVNAKFSQTIATSCSGLAAGRYAMASLLFQLERTLNAVEFFQKSLVDL